MLSGVWSGETKFFIPRCCVLKIFFDIIKKNIYNINIIEGGAI